MIRYDLKCGAGHGFDSWFKSADAYDALAAQGQLSCPLCGDGRVSKALMAPALRSPKPAGPTDAAAAPPTVQDVAQAIAALRKEVEENSEYVGMNFASEARAIHEGVAPHRPIWGEARADEARRLIEDGLPVAPLPFRPLRKAN